MAQTNQLSVDKRVSLALAAGRYIRASERLASASHEFNTAVEELRSAAVETPRFVIDIDYRTWLIEVDKNGDLDVERIVRL